MVQLSPARNNFFMNKPASDLAVTSKVSPWFSRLAYPLGSRVILPLFFGKIEVSGQENIPQDGPLIIAPTHRSRWDAFIVPYSVGKLVSGRELHFMVSLDEMQGLQGWCIRRFGGFPVDTRNPGISTVRHSVELLAAGKTLVIFPEGGIFRDKTIQPLKEGLGRIALQAKSYRPDKSVKIIPLSLRYSQEIPTWGCDIKVDIGTSIDTVDYAGLSTKRGAKQLMADLEVALKTLHEVEDSLPVIIS